MGFIEDFTKRGYHYQSTNLDNLTSLIKTEKISAYIGFDCTAKSLHVGNLMQVMILRLLQQHGHKPIIIVGGATSKIGDPTGREEARKILTSDELDQNIEGIKKSLSKFIKFGHGLDDAIMLNNSQWLESLHYINFLRDYGPLFSVNRMLTMDTVKTRLEREQSLTFLEFNYMLLQAYDFYYLNKNYNCLLQFGGSDQWGNIVMGVDLIKKLTGKEAYGMTTPLLTSSSGIKMGKSLGGAVWLNDDMLSAYDYFQYWRNCEDLDVIKFAKLYAEFSQAEITAFEQLAKNDINAAKKQLAFTLTKLCHGQESAESALQTSIRTFESRAIDYNLPTMLISRERLKQGIPAYELFFEAGITESKSASRRLIRAGGAKINDQKIDNENMLIDSAHMLNNDIIKLSSGKKRHLLVKYSL